MLRATQAFHKPVQGGLAGVGPRVSIKTSEYETVHKTASLPFVALAASVA